MKDEKHSGFKTQRNMRKSATAAPTDITPAQQDDLHHYHQHHYYYKENLKSLNYTKSKYLNTVPSPVKIPGFVHF